MTSSDCQDDNDRFPNGQKLGLVTAEFSYGRNSLFYVRNTPTQKYLGRVNPYYGILLVVTHRVLVDVSDDVATLKRKLREESDCVSLNGKVCN